MDVKVKQEQSAKPVKTEKTSRYEKRMSTMGEDDLSKVLKQLAK